MYYFIKVRLVDNSWDICVFIVGFRFLCSLVIFNMVDKKLRYGNIVLFDVILVI